MDAPDRLVITLGIEAAQETRRLAERMSVNPPEAVRRGLSLLEMFLTLKPDEELVIRNKDDGTLERIRFQWNLG